MFSPKGDHMCNIHATKGENYVKKGLAEIICTDPFSIKLNFVPKSTNCHPYTKEIIERKCVVCGCEDLEKLTGHHCIPLLYRKHYPKIEKEHNSHDVLIMCRKCHDLYEIKSHSFKKKLAKEFKVPLLRKNSRSVVYELAYSLVRYNIQMPSERRKEVLRKIKDLIGYYPTEDELENILAKKRTNLYSSTHGEEVVEKLIKNNLIDEFNVRWRKHFLCTMSPKYLPELWEIDHDHKLYSIG